MESVDSVIFGPIFAGHGTVVRLIPIENDALIVATTHDVTVRLDGLSLAGNGNTRQFRCGRCPAGTRKTVLRRVGRFAGSLGVEECHKKRGHASGAVDPGKRATECRRLSERLFHPVRHLNILNVFPRRV